MAIHDAILNALLPHFEAQQRQGQDGRCHLSLEARATQLKNEIAHLELAEAVENLSLTSTAAPGNNNNVQHSSEVEEEIGAILVQFIDATVSTETTSDFQESVDRVMALVATFGVRYSTQVADMVISRAVEFSTVLLERIRGHACILLGKIAKALLDLRKSAAIAARDNSDIDWAEANLELIQDALLPRLQDKGQAVRCQAIDAVGNFFTVPEDAETYGEILDALLWNLAHDPSVSNRIIAVQSVPVNEKTTDYIIARIRDVKPKVRAEALNTLGTKAKASNMTESQIVGVVQSGCSNR
jgi:hypothetical protein